MWGSDRIRHSLKRKSSMNIKDQDRREQLIEEGYCIVPDVLTAEFLQELRAITDHLVAGMTAEEARLQRSTGSMIPVVKDHRLPPARRPAHPPRHASRGQG